VKDLRVFMQKRALILLGLAALLARPALSAIESQEARAFVGQDLHLSGVEVISCQLSPIEYALVFQNGFTMSIGANRFSSSKAVLWLESARVEFAGQVRVDYRARAYLEGDISVDKAQGARTTQLTEKTIEQGTARVIWFGVGGEVFVTADKREAADVRELEFYKKALTAVTEVERALEKPLPSILLEKKPEVAAKPEEKEPLFRYPVNLAPVSEIVPKIEWDEEKGTGIVIGRFYLWQKQDEQGGLLELQADNAVIFYSSQKPQAGKKPAGEDFLARGAADAVYLSGDVVMTEGQRTIRAQELYYDFQGKRGIAVNAVMRNFDEMQGIPIYVRAARLRQLAENKFAAENITLTTSEFYVPQISLNASQIIITDTTSADQQEKGVTSKGSYDAQMQDVRLKMYDKTIFYWPSMRSNLQRPDIPLKSIHAGYDGTWGATIETQWYLARLLGLQESEGTDSTITLDYYSKHGIGSGVEIEYERENYFGNILGYIIDDKGEDRLGRDDSRKDIEPPRELRGRFRWQHRHFLPYDWQLTTEVSYLSDENFLEAYYRDEFNLDKEQETLIHLKRIRDNWGLAFLGKWRINDFVSQLEELPSAEFHWTGQSLFDDRFTFYSDSLLGRFRQRLAPDSDAEVSQDFFTFGSTRNELDLPLTVGRTKVVPFIAGTVGYDDGDGFRTDLDGMPEEREDNVLIGEAGVRVSPQPYWKVFPGVKSRLWDLNQMRHIISPHLTAVGFAENDSTGEQRDAINVGISQRLQTRRGPVGKERTVDWMRLDMDIMWVNNSGDTSAGPDRFIWNKPFIPLLNRYSTNVPQLDRRGGDIFGPRRNSFCADYIWRLTDTTALLSDMNFDIQSSVVQQFNVGFSHMRWPNLSYYVGSRYLRRFDNGLGEEGSNAFVFAATYVLDPRYTIVFSQQFDFDYGENVRSDITLIRRYHRIYWGITFSADESLDSHAIVFSLWPEGVPGLGIGPRRYMDLGPSVGAK
jgi:hypothetical protein